MNLKEKIAAAFVSSLDTTRSIQLKSIRQQAYAVFQEKGFPTRKQEAWKYTSLASVLKEDYDFSSVCASLDYKDISDSVISESHHRLVFVDGHFSERLSRIDQSMFEFASMRTVFEGSSYNETSMPYFSRIARQEETMTALNTALFSDGVFIRLKKGQMVETPIEILWITSSGQARMLFPRTLILVEENAQAKFIERHKSLGSSAVFTDSVTEIHVEKNALLDYYKVQDDKPSNVLIDNTYVIQHQESVASVHTFSFGGKIIRNNLNFAQQGERVESTLKGITILKGDQHADHYTLVEHLQPNNESHQDYKSILMEESSSAFNGKIWVDKVAQKTNAYQQNDTILLSEKAIVNTKPQLEIFADDVKCSHGCTVGQLDENATFYLQTRGISKKKAEALLTYAFAHTVLSSVKIAPLNTLVDALISSKLDGDI